MGDAPDRRELLTALTTEHFTLQGARAQTASESASRASLFILAVSSTLVALGFLGQGGRTDQSFEVFALTVLPGGAVGLVSLVALVRYADRLLRRRTDGIESLFPSPEAR